MRISGAQAEFRTGYYLDTGQMYSVASPPVILRCISAQSELRRAVLPSVNETQILMCAFCDKMPSRCCYLGCCFAWTVHTSHYADCCPARFCWRLELFSFLVPCILFLLLALQLRMKTTSSLTTVGTKRRDKDCPTRSLTVTPCAYCVSHVLSFELVLSRFRHFGDIIAITCSFKLSNSKRLASAPADNAEN